MINTIEKVMNSKFLYWENGNLIPNLVPATRHQLECLRAEDTPPRLIITHTIESCWIPSQNKTKSSYKFKEYEKFQTVKILEQALHMTHLLKLRDKMCKY